jgi:hypothetical protein
LHAGDVAGRRPHVRGAEGEQLAAVWAGLDAAHRLRRDADCVPLLDLDDLVVQLETAAAADQQVELLLVLVAVPEGQAVIGGEALVADRRFLQLQRQAGEPGLEVRGEAVLLGAVVDLALEVDLRVLGDLSLRSPTSSAGVAGSRAR